MTIEERKHRLSPENYIGLVQASFTICTKNKTELFTKDEIVNEFVDKLRIANNKYEIANWCYMFMPDHIHILNEGRTDNSDLLKGMNLFKQYCSYYLSKNNIGVKLQKDYYDHIHKEEEELVKQIRYLLENPVRKGLVENWEDYKYKGSLDYRLEEIIT